MDPQQMSPAPNNPEQVTVSHHGIGPLVGTLIVLAVLVLGGVYFLTNKIQTPYENPSIILGDRSMQENFVPPPSNSDAVNDISADVDATDLNDLETQTDEDLRTIEANL